MLRLGSSDEAVAGDGDVGQRWRCHRVFGDCAMGNGPIRVWRMGMPHGHAAWVCRMGMLHVMISSMLTPPTMRAIPEFFIDDMTVGPTSCAAGMLTHKSKTCVLTCTFDMCVDMCADICTGMYVDMCVDICADLCTGMYVDMCVDICADICADMCVGVCVDMCVDLCADMCSTHINTHVDEHTKTHVIAPVSICQHMSAPMC